MRYENRIPGLMLAGALMFVAVPAQSQDWIEGIFDDRCDAAATGSLTDAIRANIEAQVDRAEASIRPPAPIGDLSCLNDLMSAPIDIFSNVGGILGNLMGGLGGSIDLGGGISRQICQFAAEKWGEVTEPLNGLGEFDLPDLSSAFDNIGNPSSGATGAPPPPEPEDPNAPGGAADPTGDPGDIVVDQAGYDAALAAYNENERDVVARHLACEIARQTYTSYGGYVGGPPTAATCQAILNELDTVEPDINDYIYEQPAASTTSFSRSSVTPAGTTPERESTQTGDTDVLDQIWGTMGR